MVAHVIVSSESVRAGGVPCVNDILFSLSAVARLLVVRPWYLTLTEHGLSCIELVKLWLGSQQYSTPRCPVLGSRSSASVFLNSVCSGSSNWVTTLVSFFSKMTVFYLLFPLAPKLAKTPTASSRSSQSDCSPPELAGTRTAHYAPKQDGTWPSHAHINAGNTVRDSGNVRERLWTCSCWVSPRGSCVLTEV